ncbi:hypothetical protein RYX36_035649, partial [Vicia faba]
LYHIMSQKSHPRRCGLPNNRHVVKPGTSVVHCLYFSFFYIQFVLTSSCLLLFLLWTEEE